MVFLDSVRAEAEPVLRGDARGRSSAASPWVSAGPTACSFRWTLALLTSFLGAKLGANCGRRGAASGRIELRSLQLIGPTGRCLATPSDGRGLYGMQEVSDSNPLSSTFLQLKGIFRS
jgi:hypothetical protein